VTGYLIAGCLLAWFLLLALWVIGMYRAGGRR
jgi:hypothetical protein